MPADSKAGAGAQEVAEEPVCALGLLRVDKTKVFIQNTYTMVTSKTVFCESCQPIIFGPKNILFFWLQY